MPRRARAAPCPPSAVKISTIPHLYRNLRRGTEILSVLSKYGLADWLSRLNVEFFKDQLKDRGEGIAIARQPPHTRIRLALSDLGPTFIKVGQILSTRPDLVGAQLAEELKKLRDQVCPDPPDRVRETVERELGQPIEQLFASFNLEAEAAASIGQVHRARLKTGQPVAVKVQRAGIDRVVREDLEVMIGLAQLAEKIPEFAPYRPVETVSEVARLIRRELDFGAEERNLLQFISLFENELHLKIPQPFSDYCTPKVLTMEWIEGTKVDQVDQLRAAGVDTELLAERGARIYLRMIFEHGFFHADPHPANILILPNETIALLDFGLVGRLDEELRHDMERLLLAITRNDVAQLKSVIKKIGQLPKSLDEAALSQDLADFVGMVGSVPVTEIDVGRALTDMTEIIRRYRIRLPSQIALLIKTLVTLEGTAELLAPHFSLMEVIQRYQRRLWRQRLNPKRQWRRLRQIAYEFERVLEVVPRRMVEILEEVQAGKFDVHLDHRGLEPSVNRLVYGMLTSALFLGSSWILAAKVPPLLFHEKPWMGMQDLSLLGIAGCLASFLLGWRVLRAIRKSGRLDRHE